ncbi:hypothetical protein GTY76_34420 [Streptomyces sp. SID4951]|nr:hypothetical protein [Streptomyces sp. SID4951]
MSRGGWSGFGASDQVPFRQPADGEKSPAPPSPQLDVYTHVAQDTQQEAISHMDRLLKRRLDRD